MMSYPKCKDGLNLGCGQTKIYMHNIGKLKTILSEGGVTKIIMVHFFKSSKTEKDLECISK